MLSRSGPAHHMIFGPPGTGKTSRLLDIARGAPSSVTFCSHTRTAAHAAISRVSGETRDWSAGTIHSLCYRALGMSRAQVVSDISIQPFCRAAGFALDSDPDRPTEFRFYLHAHSYARSNYMAYHEAFEACGGIGSRTEFERFCKTYGEWKETYGFIDFTDMLSMCAKRGFAARMGTLMVDEAQDLTPLHWNVIEKMVEVSDRVIVAGDDDQAIYQWSGADPHGMAKFAESHGCDVEVLSVSHRVPRSIHRVAEEIASRLQNRQHKEYSARDAEGIADSSVRLTKQQLRDLYSAGSLMILFRNRYARSKYERMLLEDRVPYVTDVNSSPLQRKGGKAFALLRQGKWIEPNDIRVIRSGLTPYGLTMADKSGYSRLADMTGSQSCADILALPHKEIEYMQSVKSEARTVDIRTIHSSKGMEADSVVVVSSMTRSSIESLYKNPDAEHRVSYVAATRAKSNLLVISDEHAYPFPVRPT